MRLAPEIGKNNSPRPSMRFLAFSDFAVSAAFALELASSSCKTQRRRTSI
jgi:hypothetical protein